MSKKIVYIGHSSRQDGAERSYLESIKALQMNGVEIHAILPRTGPLCEQLDELGIHYDLIEFPRWVKKDVPGFFGKLRFWVGQFKLRNKFVTLFKNIRPDIVITNTIVISPFAAMAAKALNIPHYWYIREFGDLDHGLNFVLGRKKTGQLIELYSESVITNSAFVKSKFEDIITPSKMKVLYNAVENQNGIPEEVTLDFDSDFNILLLGRMVKKKGQEESIDAMKILVDQGVTAKLRLVGGGHEDYKKLLKEKISTLGLESYVELVEFTPHPKLYLQKSDLVLMCSTMEAFGRVTIEAMKQGKPVVAANTGASPEIIEEGFNGMLYEYGQPADLAKKIRYFVEHKDKLDEIGLQARQWALEKFNYQQHAEDLLSILNNSEN